MATYEQKSREKEAEKKRLKNRTKCEQKKKRKWLDKAHKNWHKINGMNIAIQRHAEDGGVRFCAIDESFMNERVG